MNSFSAVLSKLDALPLNVSWQLESIAEKRGHQELYTRQSPEQLARLREYAMVEEMSGRQQGDDQVGAEGASGLLRLRRSRRVGALAEGQGFGGLTCTEP